ncbi:MAG: hypothetical protein M3Y87_26910 [Myxococcota bacterium]|nr:hypothetical protein [Myxococcota bacterium]
MRAALLIAIASLLGTTSASAQTHDDRRAWSRAIEAHERGVFESMFGPLRRGELTVYRGRAEVRDNAFSTPGRVVDFSGPVIAILHTTGDDRWLLTLARADGAHAELEQHPRHPGDTFVSGAVDASQRAGASGSCTGCVASLEGRPARLDVVLPARGWDQRLTLDGHLVLHARLALERVDVTTLDAREIIALSPAMRLVSSRWDQLAASLRVERGALVRDVRAELRLATRWDDDTRTRCEPVVEYDVRWRIARLATRPLTLSRATLRAHVTTCCRSVGDPHAPHGCHPPREICERAELPL